MRIVLDTNVVVSGIFFGGPPGAILEAWAESRFDLAISPDMFDELTRVAHELANKYQQVDFVLILERIALSAEFVEVQQFDQQVCDDPDDDKFLECALSAGAHFVVSGDKHLLKVSGSVGVEVIRPREFVDRFLN